MNKTLQFTFTAHISSVVDMDLVRKYSLEIYVIKFPSGICRWKSLHKDLFTYFLDDEYGL